MRAITASDELAAIAIDASNVDELHFTDAQFTASDELAAIAIDASNVDELHFTDAQFELLFDQLDAMDNARRAVWLALLQQRQKADARAQILHKILDRGV